MPVERGQRGGVVIRVGQRVEQRPPAVVERATCIDEAVVNLGQPDPEQRAGRVGVEADDAALPGRRRPADGRLGLAAGQRRRRAERAPARAVGRGLDEPRVEIAIPRETDERRRREVGQPLRFVQCEAARVAADDRDYRAL
jgi:hypothetical protein